MNFLWVVGKTDIKEKQQSHAWSNQRSAIQSKDELSMRRIVDRLRKQFRAISTMSLHGMPPLPKSLSGFTEGETEAQPPASPGDKPPSDLDSQLIYLKKEMVNIFEDSYETQWQKIFYTL